MKTTQPTTKMQRLSRKGKIMISGRFSADLMEQIREVAQKERMSIPCFFHQAAVELLAEQKG